MDKQAAELRRDLEGATAWYDRMLEAFGDWEGVPHAPLDGLIHALRTTRWPAPQAPRIQDILGCIKAERGVALRSISWLTGPLSAPCSGSPTCPASA